MGKIIISWRNEGQMKPKSKNQQITVGFIALGCPKNIVDSEVMLAHLGQAGFILTHSIDDADVVIVNTCGFIEPAKQEALEELTAVCALKDAGKVKCVIAAGCLPQRLGDKLGEILPKLDAVVGLEHRDRIVQIVQQCIQKKHLIDSGGLKAPIAALEPFHTIFQDTGRLLLSPPHWAYVRISEGCNRRCAFCTIPAIRGKFRSKPIQWIIREAEELAANGAVELILIAQDTVRYGRDLEPPTDLIELLRRLNELEGISWIRLMYLYPSGIDDALLDAIVDCDKVVHYLDIPIQHINNKILKLMRRADSKEKNIALIEKVRSKIPDAVLRTTCIVGYPGETEREFEELIEFIRWAQFDALGCFPFYPEQGTPAAEADGQVPEEVKRQRVDQLMLTQQEIVFQKMDNWKGRQLEVLVDQKDSQGAIGRYYGQAPHIDGHCWITPVSGRSFRAGQFVSAQVIGRRGYDFVVKPI